MKSATAKERKFAEGVASGKSKKWAALDAGYSLSMALNAGDKILSKPEVQTYYRRLMQETCPPEKLIKRIAEHVDGRSVTTRIRKRVVPNGNGEKVTETTVEKVETVDAGASLRAIELAIAGAQYMPPQNELQISPLTQVQIEGDALVVQKLLGPGGDAPTLYSQLVGIVRTTRDEAVMKAAAALAMALKKRGGDVVPS